MSNIRPRGCNQPCKDSSLAHWVALENVFMFHNISTEKINTNIKKLPSEAETTKVPTWCKPVIWHQGHVWAPYCHTTSSMFGRWCGKLQILRFSVFLCAFLVPSFWWSLFHLSGPGLLLSDVFVFLIVNSVFPFVRTLNSLRVCLTWWRFSSEDPVVF